MPKLFEAYDFLDFGCSKGDSMSFARKTFGGRGLGLDIDPVKVESSRQAGLDAIVQDCTRLDPGTMGQVRFVIMSHFLEHLRSTVDARKCIEAACAISREFVLIKQPWFDSDPYLFGLGLKLYWSSWTGHPNHMTRLEMLNVLLGVAGRGQVKRFFIGGSTPITSSAEPQVHPLLARPDQHAWVPEHGPKPVVTFSEPVYKELFAVILLANEEPSPELSSYIGQKRNHIYFDSSKPYGPADAGMPA